MELLPQDRFPMKVPPPEVPERLNVLGGDW